MYKSRGEYSWNRVGIEGGVGLFPPRARPAVIAVVVVV